MKNDPPTHLLVSVTGDYLRGRLIVLDQDHVQVEIRLELMEIPVSQIAQIVWLHDREWTAESPVDESENASTPDTQVAEPTREPFQIHAVVATGRGLTFQPRTIEAGKFLGTSELLGEVSVEFSEINQLYFGRDIAAQIRQDNTENSWTLELARYPRVFLAENSENGPSLGMDSPLIGQLAPDFGLQTLDGRSFRLSKNRDRVVVLDFWASWCGPCMQTMPVVDRMVQEVGSDKIHLVAVNVQETSRRAQVAIDRLELLGTVLMDIDGEVAAAYAANAIPQTVIIDRDGYVVSLFVGGGSHFEEQLRETLLSIIAE
jgi:thiol-disulfide isomerase/thioredoxin